MNAFDPRVQAMGLFGGIGVVLLIASVIGRVLKTSVARDRPHGVIDNLNARIRAWWVMVAVCALAFLLGRVGVTLLFLFISGVALREFAGLRSLREGVRAPLVAGCFVVLPVQYLLIQQGWFGLYAIFVPICAFVILPLISAASGAAGEVAERVARMRWGLMICVYCISFVPALLTLDIPGYAGRNLLLIVFLTLVVQSSDVLQYVWGMLIGRRKVAPVVSPSKTWEGLVGGVASATALGAALYWITPFAPSQAALLALSVNTLGFLGGLMMSAIKRTRGVKDWGGLIDGHGGMLDRLDSLVFAAPVFFLLTRLGWT
jgi:phosphatidate cytidylyltransferase